MTRIWIALAALNGLVAVAAGAFGAHALKHRLESNDLAAFEVAARYQMYHALAILAGAWFASVRPSRTATAACVCFLLGTLLFSGSLYGLSLAHWKRLGPVTPIGGALLMLGWGLLAVAAMLRPSEVRPLDPPN